jgi:hypothetical protein
MSAVLYHNSCIGGCGLLFPPKVAIEGGDFKYNAAEIKHETQAIIDHLITHYHRPESAR